MKLWDQKANKARLQFYKIMKEVVGLRPGKMDEALKEWLAGDGVRYASYILAWDMAAPFIKKKLGLDPESHVKWNYVEFVLSRRE